MSSGPHIPYLAIFTWPSFGIHSDWKIRNQFLINHFEKHSVFYPYFYYYLRKLAQHTSCNKYVPLFFFFFYQRFCFCSEIFRVRHWAAGDADVPQDPARDPEAHHEQVRESSRPDCLLLRHTGAAH
jgi:hypothetical protein